MDLLHPLDEPPAKGRVGSVKALDSIRIGRLDVDDRERAIRRFLVPDGLARYPGLLQ